MLPRPTVACILIISFAAITRLGAEDCVVRNDRLVSTWQIDGGQIKAGSVRDLSGKLSIPFCLEQVQLRFADGQTSALALLKPIGNPSVSKLEARPEASRLSEQLPGSMLEVRLADKAGRFTAAWSVQLREGSRYIRVCLTVKNTGRSELPLEGVQLIDLQLPNAATVGDYTGSPVVAGTTFLAVEHPLGRSSVIEGRVQCVMPCISPLRPGESFEAQAVIGFTDPGQLRRDFACYLERERAHPYRPFLHHNTWYNIGYRNSFTESDLLTVIDEVGGELVTNRGVTMDGFVLDDGWDDPETLWNFNTGFPRGLKAVTKRAQQYGAGIGIWLSPWGGYGGAKASRLAKGAEKGYEIRHGSFSLAGPLYYKRFREICSDVLRKDGVSYFKFDGIGSQKRPDVVDPSSGRDFEAMIRLIAELRSISPSVFINQTTGTWPSPFWLLKVDSIWRGGEDHDFAGIGSDRERWITYRDAETYANVVRRSPLYPLNSLMVHGIIYGVHAAGLATDPDSDFTSEVRSYFGSGTQLQELYISPELLTQQNWDDLADAARWSRSNAATLCDTHWIGGDPEKLMVYGWAAWSPHKGIITLRNPSDRAAKFKIEVEKLFELPANAPQSYAVSSPFPRTNVPIAILRAHYPAVIELPAFGVDVLEATPQ